MKLKIPENDIKKWLFCYKCDCLVIRILMCDSNSLAYHCKITKKYVLFIGLGPEQKKYLWKVQRKSKKKNGK